MGDVDAAAELMEIFADMALDLNQDGMAVRTYVHRNTLVGRVMARLDKDDVLMVISDHGFSSFRRGVNLNAWLQRHGYLVLKPGADGRGEWLRDVDWSRTRAYAIGLTGLFLNIRGREQDGIVAPTDAAALKAEIASKLNGLRDEARGEVRTLRVDRVQTAAATRAGYEIPADFRPSDYVTPSMMRAKVQPSLTSLVRGSCRSCCSVRRQPAAKRRRCLCWLMLLMEKSISPCITQIRCCSRECNKLITLP